MKTVFLVASFLLPASAALAQGAPPAAAAKDVFDMQCSLFRHNADGSWAAARPMTLNPASGSIPLKPSFHFRPGTLFAGFDLAKALDDTCVK